MRVYTIGNRETNRFLSSYETETGELRYTFHAHHLAHAKLWQNRVEARKALKKLEKDAAMKPDGFRLLAFDCTEVQPL
jgi:hypothetical protein